MWSEWYEGVDHNGGRDYDDGCYLKHETVGLFRDDVCLCVEFHEVSDSGHEPWQHEPDPMVAPVTYPGDGFCMMVVSKILVECLVYCSNWRPQSEWEARPPFTCGHSSLSDP